MGEQFVKRPLGLQFAPVKGDDTVTVCYAVSDNASEGVRASLGGHQPVLYRVNGRVVYGKVQFDEVMRELKECEVGEAEEGKVLELVFVRQSFNVQRVQREIQALVKKELNPLFRVRDLYVIDKLPRTASGKVMRRVLRSEYSSSRKK